LLSESYRDGARDKKHPLENFSALLDEQIGAMRELSRGQSSRPTGELFEVIQSLPHGHVQAVSATMNRSGFGTPGLARSATWCAPWMLRA
jgi:hypothetical protein